MNLLTGCLIPVDGVLVYGDKVKCDESSAAGESSTQSGIFHNTPADEVFHAGQNQHKIMHFGWAERGVPS